MHSKIVTLVRKCSNNAHFILKHTYAKIQVKQTSFNTGCDIIVDDITLYTASPYIDKDSFECPEPRLMQKCHIPLGEHQSPAGKFFQKQKIDFSLFMCNSSFDKMLV